MNRTLVALVLLAIFLAMTTWVCAMSVVMNGAFSTVADGAVQRQYIRAAVVFEVLTVLSFLATLAVIVLIWRRRRR